MIIDSIQASIGVFLLIGVGFILAKKDIFSAPVKNMLSHFIVYFTLPCTVIGTVQRQFRVEDFSELGMVLLVSFLAVLVMFFVGWLWVRIAKIPKSRRGLYIQMVAISNASFIGFPVISAIFGEPGMKSALMFFMACMLFTHSLSYVMIQQDAASIKGESVKIQPSSILKKLITPPVIAMFIGILLMFLRIELPKFAMICIDSMGELTSPLALLFTGTVVHEIGFKNMRLEKGIIDMLFLRLAVSGLVMFALTSLFGITGLNMQVIVVQMALPCMIHPITVCKLYGADYQYAAKLVIFSLLASFVTIPVTLALVS